MDAGAVITVEGALNLAEDVRFLAAGLRDRRDLMQELGDLQTRNILARVERRQGVDGSTYPESKRAGRDGIAGKKGRGRSLTLWDTGAMLTSMRVLSASPTESVVGFSDLRQSMKANWHNFGTVRTPQREFFGISLDEGDALVDHADDWLDGRMKDRDL